MTREELEALTDAELRAELELRAQPPAAIEFMLVSRADPAWQPTVLAALQNAPAGPPPDEE